ncbi:hypothetical protein K439DRAFT_1616402 [Ramaria rubella]|nr:hypothetical protein K439DRAFT_1616402 [Ramaria rubella]
MLTPLPMRMAMQTTPNNDNTVSISPSPSAGPYAQPLSPYHQAKLVELDAMSCAELAKERIRKRDAKAEKCVVQVKWWQHDGRGSVNFHVCTGDHGKFLPVQCDDIQKLVPNCETYEYFDAEEHGWITMSLAILVVPKTTYTYTAVE